LTPEAIRFSATAATLLAKLVASDGAPSDQFGTQVAITRSLLLVGSGHPVDSKGSLYVFEKNSNGQYSEAGELVASSACVRAFGRAVAATDAGSVVGGDTCAMYVFEKNSAGQYQEVSKLLAGSGASWGGVAATGSGWVAGFNGSSVYVFEKNSTGQYEQVNKLVASDGAAGDLFGSTVAATDNNMVVIGAIGDDDKGNRSGSVYVFEKNSTGQFEQVSKLVASDGAAYDNFGSAVAAADGLVVVGATYTDETRLHSGSVYVFEKNSTGQYEQVSKLVSSDGAAAKNLFGRDLAVTGGVIIAGAWFDDTKGSSTGAVYFFDKNSTGHYRKVRKLVPSGVDAGDGFGVAVAAADGTVVVGAFGDDRSGGQNHGAVYVFE
jgi:hypothetical protein